MQHAKLSDLLNMNITFRSPTGAVKSLPLSSFVTVDYTTTLGSVKRKKYKRVITLTSNVFIGYTTTDVNNATGRVIYNSSSKNQIM